MSRKGSVIWETIETVAVALVLTLVIRHFVVESFVVRGNSMESTLHDGERLLVSKFSYRLHPPQRGDIIVFRSPVSRGDDLIKRVIATQGERVEIVNGQIYMDGKALDEPYISRRDLSNLEPQRVPEGKVFVLGDNRPNSEDSRFFGAIELNRIKGKAVVIWWPFAYFSVLSVRT